MGRCCVGTMGRRTVSPLLLLVPALVAAATVDPETSRLLAEVNGGLAADVSAAEDSVGEHSVARHDYVGHFPAGLGPVDYGRELPFGARTRPVPEHPLNEHFRYLDDVRREKYGDIYNKHPKLSYKPKYYPYPKYGGHKGYKEEDKYEPPVYENYKDDKYEGPKYGSYKDHDKYETPKYESYKYEKPKYESPKYESYIYEKPKYKGLKYKSPEYPRSKYVSKYYDEYKEYEPKSEYETPKYHEEYKPEPVHYYERPPPPPPYFASGPQPPRYEPHAEAEYAVLPPPPTDALHHLPPPPPPPVHVYPEVPRETFHYTEEHHVTETYPAPPPPPPHLYAEHRAPPPPPPPPAVHHRGRGHRAGKAFAFNPEPYIETIAIAYHENERNFNSRHRGHRQGKHLEYTTPRYPGPHPEYPPRVYEHPEPAYAPRVPVYPRHVPPHVPEYVAPHDSEYVAPRGRGYGRLVGGHAPPERTVTLTPYRVQVGTLYGLASAASNLSETVVKSDQQAAAEAKESSVGKTGVKSDDSDKENQKA